MTANLDDAAFAGGRAGWRENTFIMRKNMDRAIGLWELMLMFVLAVILQ
ncbi:MAG: hypothetical protein ACMG55_19430 [Microcoleus sp.]